MKFTCVACGTEGEASKRVQPHCRSANCVRGYAEWVFNRSWVAKGDHMIWTGLVRWSTHGRPDHNNAPLKAIRVAGVGSTDLKRDRKELRAVVVGLGLAGIEPGGSGRIRNLCDEPLCVSPDCHEYIVPEDKEELSGKLDAAPLLHAIRCRADYLPIPNSTTRSQLRSARETGRLTVGAADKICCDYLGVNPIEIFGSEFLSA